MRIMGIEPMSSVWKTENLPLIHIRFINVTKRFIVFAWAQEESPTLLLIQVNNLQKRFLGKSYRNSKVKSVYENIQSKPYQK
jgi:hypothetical protein